MKSGDYLSSRRLSASTFGVRKLNFCVRYGNRWFLSAIITTIVIYHKLSLAINTKSSDASLCFFSPPDVSASFFQSPFPKIYNYIAISYVLAIFSSFLKLVKIIDFLVKRFRFKKALSLSFIEIKPSTY